MSSRPPLLLVALSFVAVACAPAPGPLVDPREILAKAADATAAASSVRYVASIEGSVALPPVGGAAQPPLDLAGTTFAGAVAIADRAATGTLTIPGLGPAVETVVAAGRLYLRSGLLGGGWRPVGDASSTPLGSVADPAALLRRVVGELDALPVPPAKGSDVDCGEARCYRVILGLPASSEAGVAGGLVEGLAGRLGDLVAGGLGGVGGGGAGNGGAGSGDPLGDLLDMSGGTMARRGATLEVLVRIDDLRPYSLTLRPEPADATGGSAALPPPTVSVVLSDWDEPLRIDPPR